MISQKSSHVITYFNEILSDAKCALNYTKDYELVIAVMLSAQTTDKAVNNVTKGLFEKYQTLESFATANILDIENEIKSLGLYKNKAKNIILLTHKILNEYDGKVPNSFSKLISLEGVGRKTANVVLCELFQKDEFPVDTHINRIAKRLGYAKEDDTVLQVEMKLRKSFPKEAYIKLHHQFIHFGRQICKSSNPKCENCQLKTYCKYFNK